METVSEVIKDCENFRIKIFGVNKFNDCDGRIRTYFEGNLCDISKDLMNCEVLYTGYSYSSECPCIAIPYINPIGE